MIPVLDMEKEYGLVLEGGGNVPREDVEPPKCGEILQRTESPEEMEESGSGTVRGERPEARHRTGSGAAGAEQTMSGQAFVRDDFDTPNLHLDYQSLRIPMDEHYISLTERPGWLRMYGRSGLASRFSQSLIARRVTEYQMEADTCLDFAPEVFKQMAGLILLYDTDNYLYLHLSHDEDVGKCITLLKAENKKYEYLTDYIPVESERDVILHLSLTETQVQFSY